MVVCSSGRIVSLSALASQGSDPTSAQAAMEAPSAAGLGLGSAAGVPHVQVTHATAAATFLHLKTAFAAAEAVRDEAAANLARATHSYPLLAASEGGLFWVCVEVFLLSIRKFMAIFLLFSVGTAFSTCCRGFRTSCCGMTT